MEYCRFNDIYVLRLDKGDEIITSLLHLCQKEDISLGTVTGLGAVDHVLAGIYNLKEKSYHQNEFKGEKEIVSLTGSITRKDGDVYLHIHIAVSGEDGSVVGGHLNEARISATSEIIISKFVGKVERKYDCVIGLNLLDFLK